MATQLKISSPASALLALAALLAASARASDWVTTAECRARGVTLQVRLYPTDTNATELWMNDCNLTRIDNPDAFTGLPKVNTIWLSYNNIENINPAAFHTIPALTTLWLQSNKLRELPVFDERSCANLTNLYLDSNNLTAVDNAGTFSACARLQTLDLGYNSIEFIHPNVFNALTELKTLYLNDNKIRIIPDRMFGSSSKLQRLYLYNNLITHLPPDFVSSLQRAGASLVKFYFLGNPWNCACLLELLADVQRAGVINYQKVPWKGITHYGGALPECNYINMRNYPCSKIRELNLTVHGVR